MPDPHDVSERTGSFGLTEAERAALRQQEQERLAMRDPEVPQGWIRGWPDRRREHRFGFAIPILLTMVLSTLVILIGVNVVGARGSLQTDFIAWMAGLPILTLIAVAAGTMAANRAWARDREVTIWRPISWGVATAVSVAFAGFAFIGFVAIVN